MKSTTEEEQRPLNTRERILHGAAVVAAERGLRAVTVQDILAAASVSRRTFYQHFPNTEGVLCDLYIETMTELQERVRAAVASQATPRQRLRATMDAYVDALHAGGLLLVWLQGEAIRPGSMLAPIRSQVHDSLLAVIAGEAASVRGARPSPLLLRGLLLGAEGLLLQLQHDGVLSDSALGEVRAVVGAMTIDAIGG